MLSNAEQNTTVLNLYVLFRFVTQPLPPRTNNAAIKLIVARVNRSTSSYRPPENLN